MSLRRTPKRLLICCAFMLVPSTVLQVCRRAPCPATTGASQHRRCAASVGASRAGCRGAARQSSAAKIPSGSHSPIACACFAMLLQIAGAINADDPHYPCTSLVCLENTTNKGGGALYTLRSMKSISKVSQNKKGCKLAFMGPWSCLCGHACCPSLNSCLPRRLARLYNVHAAPVTRLAAPPRGGPPPPCPCNPLPYLPPQLCRERGLALHLDGARVFNAFVASRSGEHGRWLWSV